MRAAALIRHESRIWENRDAFVANALLRAAAGEPYRVPTAEEEALFEELHRLAAMPLKDAFALLSQRCPELTGARDALQQQRQTLRYDKADQPDAAEALWDALLERLDHDLHGQPVNDDLLVRSEVAYQLARRFLAEDLELLAEGDDGD